MKGQNQPLEFAASQMINMETKFGNLHIIFPLLLFCGIKVELAIVYNCTINLFS